MPKQTIKEQEEKFRNQEAIEESQKVEAYSLSFDDLQKRSLTVREETGQAELVDKDELVGKAFIIPPFGWKVRESDKVEPYYDEETKELVTPQYVSVEAILKEYDKKGRNRRVIFNDGGTGIIPLLDQLPKDQPIFVEKGLRKSVFKYAPDLGRALGKKEIYNGKVIEATTYYLT